MVLRMYRFATNDLVHYLRSVNWVMEIRYWLKRGGGWAVICSHRHGVKDRIYPAVPPVKGDNVYGKVGGFSKSLASCCLY
jgi:hypothetical protein